MATDGSAEQSHDAAPTIAARSPLQPELAGPPEPEPTPDTPHPKPELVAANEAS